MSLSGIMKTTDNFRKATRKAVDLLLQEWLNIYFTKNCNFFIMLHYVLILMFNFELRFCYLMGINTISIFLEGPK